MKSVILVLALFSIIGCGSQQGSSPYVLQSTTGSEQETLFQPGAGASGPIGSICSWDYGAGIGGIYSTLSEFQSFVQSKVNSGVITHCVSVNGEMLKLSSPNGLFGPCMGAVSQLVASPAIWSSCVSNIQ